VRRPTGWPSTPSVTRSGPGRPSTREGRSCCHRRQETATRQLETEHLGWVPWGAPQQQGRQR
jgi:hypothetical protein